MMLTLSDEQSATLLRLAYLGEIVLNDWTPEADQTDEHHRGTDLLYQLCEQVAGTEAGRMAERLSESGEWIPSEQLRAEMQEYLRAYDEEVFWDELIHRLARRDLGEEYGEQALGNLSDAHFQKADASLLDYYDREVRQHGTDRLYVREETPVQR
jgi:hypothetical protein